MLGVLFVDDDPRILEGLSRMLRPMRHAWTMRFVDGGEAALAALATQPADVVVTDMRMPGMTGADLLDAVKQRWPDAIRIVLSGHADQELVARTVCTAHQFLNKPCDPDSLKDVITRARRLRDGFENPALRRLVGGVDRLPCLPTAYDELTRVLADPQAPVTAAAAIVARDPGLSLKLLQVVNSAFFGLRRRVDDPGEAASLLGLEALRALLLSVHAFRSFAAADVARAERLSAHAIAVGTLARAIARLERAPKAVADQAFLAGMMHDIGQVVLGDRVGQNYAHLVEEASAHRVAIEEVEQPLIGTTHAQVGAYLLGIWGLGDDVVAAVAFHHRPSLSPSPPTFAALAAVHVADALLDGGALDQAYVDAAGVAPRLDAWRALAAQPAGAAP